MVKVNEKAPDFILYNTDLKPVKLNDFKGKVVVLSFFQQLLRRSVLKRCVRSGIV